VVDATKLRWRIERDMSIAATLQHCGDAARGR